MKNSLPIQRDETSPACSSGTTGKFPEKLVPDARAIVQCILILVLLTPALFAQPARLTFPPITREEVWRAVEDDLHTRGLRPEQFPRIEDLDLPVTVPAAEGRSLRVAAACWDAGFKRVQFRISCHEPGECIPFLAYVRSAENVIAGSCRAKSATAPNQVAVRAGQRAMLVSAANHLRLTTSVTCLERGAEGDIIRVKNEDGHIFRARVTAPAVLEAWPQ